MITIAGLGYRSELPVGVAAFMQATPLVYLRTTKHPALGDLSQIAFQSCDALLDAPDAASEIARQLLAIESDVLYLVPGHPRVADETVAALVGRAPHRCRIIAGEHPIDAYADELGLHGASGTVQWTDALAWVPIPDTRDSWATFHAGQYPPRVTPIPVRPHADAWICNVTSAVLYGHVCAVLRSHYPAAARCAFLRGHGLVEWTTIGTMQAPTTYPLTICIPAVPALENVRSADGILYVIERLLGPGGCPWDHEQTPESLRRTLLEETYEAIDAIDRGDDRSLVEELGDILLNILMQTEMARQAARFRLEDVYEAVTTKFIRRHPHVFGDVAAHDSEAVLKNWYAIKATEGDATTAAKSPLAGVPLALPALTATSALINKSKRYGMHLGDMASDPPSVEQLGEQLFALAVTAAHHNLDAESALRAVNAAYRRRVDALYVRDGHLNGQTQELWRDADSNV
ncbi:MAG: hypothetical protein RLY87_274 [Chloroflexota bacterium]|jgi:tetrapyrrole methylase family protein/MazG family protein